jgi:ribosomal protein L16 Arg81 hydroxylase
LDKLVSDLQAKMVNKKDRDSSVQGRRSMIVLKPGDRLYIPAGYVHAAFNISDEPSITFTLFDVHPANLEAVVGHLYGLYTQFAGLSTKDRNDLVEYIWTILHCLADKIVSGTVEKVS